MQSWALPYPTHSRNGLTAVKGRQQHWSRRDKSPIELRVMCGEWIVESVMLPTAELRDGWQVTGNILCCENSKDTLGASAAVHLLTAPFISQLPGTRLALDAENHLAHVDLMEMANTHTLTQTWVHMMAWWRVPAYDRLHTSLNCVPVWTYVWMNEWIYAVTQIRFLACVSIRFAHEGSR